jgi:DnaJ-class molecular chaperone
MADNYYNILGIKPNCTKEEIKKTYRKLSLQHHPDRPNGTKAMFQKISKAYEILSDEIKKKNYDANLNVKKNTQQENNQFPNMGYFHRAFGMDPRFGASQNHFFRNMNNILNINKNIEISIQECWSGTIKQVSIDRTIIINNRKLIETKSVLARIPAGIKSNSVLVLRGQGNIHNGVSGDVKIHIKLTNNTEYVRDGLDLIYKKKITFKESLVGFKFELKHISGKKYSINNYDGKVIYDGYMKVVKNLGFHFDSNNVTKNGNLLIMFEVDKPEKLSKEIREQLDKILPD